MFFHKKSKFPNYIVVTSEGSNFLEIFPRRYIKELKMFKDNRYYTIEESFKLMDKYYAFCGNFPKEIAYYIKENVPDHMLCYDINGRLIGFEFEEELAK